MSSLRSAWPVPEDVAYLNHGSFGPSPRVVQAARDEWSRRLERQPMDFFVRQMEPHLDAAAETLGRFAGCRGEDLIFVENATAGMNLVAASLPLAAGDEVLLTNHEYGAVLRIWRTVCERAGANVVVRDLSRGVPPRTGPARPGSADEIADGLLEAVTERTRLIVVSHVTSPTAIVLPVELICQRAKERGVPVCIDGPHALAMRPVNVERLGCDFYAASCHKWLCGPFGSGFLYVSKRWQAHMRPTTISWGGSVSGRPASWKDEFTWPGTRDPAAYLALTAAIEFLEDYGLDRFRDQTHRLARYARARITELTGLEPLVPDSLDWYGSMIALPLP
ncbi:MAG: aminotransferase class V-fold PLP-dependent enzyme, partial [Planctomycetaceae bacterium]